MDTTEFLKLILPERGVIYIMRRIPRPDKPKDASVHVTAPDAETAAETLLALDAKYTNNNVYYAMASYKEVLTKTTDKGFEYVVGRKQGNVLAVKSLWLDLDVGKDGCYETQREAASAVYQYCGTTGLPRPVMVSSGYGLHCYWPFTESVAADVWEDIAKHQRAAWKHLKLKADPACDQDCARVLRAPGCHNRRDGQEPKLVRVISKEVNVLPAAEYKRRLVRFAAEAKLEVAPTKAPMPDWMKASMVGNLDGVAEFPKSFAAIAVHHCNQIKDFARTGGASEPLWYANLGLMKHFEDGQRFAHEWGSNHDSYNEADTQQKLDQWGVGPTTCGRFKELNATACEGCTHKCTSPVQLGQSEEIEKPNIIDMVTDGASELATEVDLETAVEDADEDGVPFGWPERFGFTKESLTAKVQDASGVWQEVAVATPLFYPVEQIREEDGTLSLRMHTIIRGGEVREFTMPQKYLADTKGLKMQLASYGIHVLNADGASNFTSKMMINMQKLRRETDTYKQMGWHHDYKAFLIGDTLVTADDTRKVVVNKNCADLVGINNPTGTKEAWIKAVDTLYNRAHGEPYQFAICAAFAAPMHQLLGFSEWRGIPYAITTDESGFGKTTVNMVANAIWYDPEKAKVSDSTPKATLSFASAFNSLPFLLDEVTQYLKDPADMAAVLYAMSNGRPRQGMGGDGKRRDSLPPWIGCCGMTGNRNILLQLAENRLVPEATQMRVFEIDLDSYPRLTTMDKLHPDYKLYNEDHGLLSKTIPAENHSIIGVEYVQYIIKHLDEVREKLRDVSSAFAKLADGDATKERYYYHLITTVLVGGYYAKKLGYINFDLTALKHWCIKHVERLRTAVKETARSPEDQFAAMMAEFTGRMLVTRNFDALDGRAGKTEDHKGPHIRGEIVGRYVVGDGKERPKLYVTINAIRQWCFEQGLSVASVRRDFISAGYIRFGTAGVSRDTGLVRVAIGKGVNGYQNLRNPNCWELDVAKAEYLPELQEDPKPAPQAEVVHLQKTGTEDDLVIDL